MPYITPESTPVSTACFSISVPDDPIMLANFRGAIMALAERWNWQNVDGISEDDAAALWNTAYETIAPCEVTPVANKRVGEFFWWAGDTPPDGALECDGSYLDPAVYPDLFAAIGYTWGQSGDNFKIPDMTDGRFACSYGTGTGSPHLGEITGTNQYRDVPLPEHSHELFVGAASGAVKTSPTVQTRTGGTKFSTELIGQTPSVIDILPKRAGFMPCIEAE